MLGRAAPAAGVELAWPRRTPARSKDFRLQLCKRKSRLSQGSRRQGRTKKGPLPCQEGESCCSLHKQWLSVLSSAPQHRLGPGGDRSAGCPHPLLCRTGPSSSPGAALIHGISSWASSPTVFGLCAAISSFQNDKTPHSHPQLPARSHPVPQPSTSYTPAPSSGAARCQAALNPGKRGEMPGPHRERSSGEEGLGAGVLWDVRSYPLHAKSPPLSGEHRALPRHSVSRLQCSKSDGSCGRSSKHRSTSELETDEVTSRLKSLPFSSCSENCATERKEWDGWGGKPKSAEHVPH